MSDTNGLFDVGDEVAENNANRDEVRRRREDHETVSRVLGHKNGRAWMHRLLQRCQVRGRTEDDYTPFVAGQPDTTAFRLGKQSIGRFLEEACEAFPDLYMKMLAEARNEEARIANVHDDEQRRRTQTPQEFADEMQGFPLPPPPGFPGHKPEKRS